MCQYSSVDGLANDWHQVHLGSRAVGGVGLIIVEATGVTPEARISDKDMGLWNEAQVEALKPITAFAKSQGAAIGVQLAHAGRKASTYSPEAGKSGALSAADGAWQTLAPSAVKFAENYPLPKEMTEADIQRLIADFVHSSNLAIQAGYQLIELHYAHGYLMHEFMSPLSNKRTDNYGGSFENRIRMPLEVAKAVRAALPEDFPLIVRISATDWTEGGWDLPQSIQFCQELKKLGVDLIDVSTGGNVPQAKIPVAPNYQVPFAEGIKKEVGINTGAVGLITEAHQAEKILQENQADVVLLARELLRDPQWALHAAHALQAEVTWPNQYLRARPK